MKALFSLNPHEVYHLRNLLLSAGIKCRLRNENMISLAGEVPFTECAPQLLLEREQDRETAELILADWRNRPPHRGPGWACQNCGEAIEEQFTACWKCGLQRTDLAAP